MLVALTERLALLIDAKADGAVRDIRMLAKEAGKTDDASKKLEARGQAIGTAFKVGAGVVAGAALIKLAQLSGDAIDAAAALGEQQSKTNVVFGDAADKVREFGRDAAESLNLSEREALSAASTFGQFFDAAGMATDAGADMSMAMVKLAADMASFQDADPSEVLENLRSGLSGESEPLRKFGVFLNEGAVAAKAAELGLQGLNGKLTDGEKIQARYAIIMEQTAKQQGDLARTADSLSNRQREAAAQAENASAALGQGLIPAQLALTNAFIDAVPAITAVARGVGNTVEAFTSLPGPLQAVVGGVTVASAGFLLLGPRIAATKVAMAELNITSGKTGAAMKGLGAAAAAAVAVYALDAALGAVTDSLADAPPKVQELTSALLDLRDGKAQGLGDDFENLGSSIELLGSKTSTSLRGIEDSIPVLSKLDRLLPGDNPAERMDKATASLQALDSALANLAATASASEAESAFEALAKSQDLSAAKQKELLGLLPQYKEALAGAENQTRLTAGATSDLGAATSGLVPPTAEAIKAQEKLAEAQQKLRQEARGTGQAFVGLGDSASDAKVSLNSWIEDMQEQAQALRNFTANARTAADRGLRQGLIAALQEMGPAGAMRLQQLANASKSEIGKANQAWRSGQDAMRAYVNFKVPPKKIEVDAGAALATVNSLQAKLNALPREKRIRIISQVFGGSGVNPVPPGVRAPRERSSAPFVADDIRGSGGGFTGRAGGGLASLDTMLKRDAEATKGHARDVDDNRRKLREHTQELRAAKDSFKQEVMSSLGGDIFDKGGLAGTMAQLQTDATNAATFGGALKNAEKLGLKGQAFQALATSGDVKAAQELDTREEVAAFMALFNQAQAAKQNAANFAGNEVYGKRIADSLDRQGNALNRTLDRLPAAVERGVVRGMDINDRALRARVS